MWKPGQLVTIEGKVYRVKKHINDYTCTLCAFIKRKYFCKYPKCTEKIPFNCYFKQVYPKT